MKFQVQYDTDTWFYTAYVRYGFHDDFMYTVSAPRKCLTIVYSFKV